MTAYPPVLDLPALARARGSVRLPGSKSISNRTLLLAALAQGTTIIHDLLSSDDVDRMLEALETLGVGLERTADPEVLRVHGCGGAFPVKRADLFLGNAGTAYRPLTAALALSGGHYRLSGVPRMHERPIGDLVDVLRQAGAPLQQRPQLVVDGVDLAAQLVDVRHPGAGNAPRERRSARTAP